MSNIKSKLIMSETDNQKTMIRQLKRLKNAVIAGATLPVGAATEAEQVVQSALLTSIELKNNLKTLQDNADDFNLTFAYLDAGAADERVSTITYRGTTSPVTPDVTKTFVYAGGAGAYRVSTITLS